MNIPCNFNFFLDFFILKSFQFGLKSSDYVSETEMFLSFFKFLKAGFRFGLCVSRQSEINCMIKQLILR